MKTLHKKTSSSLTSLQNFEEPSFKITQKNLKFLKGTSIASGTSFIPLQDAISNSEKD